MIEPGEVAAILLAAGQSRRFGEADKLLAPAGGAPLVSHAARTLLSVGFGRCIAVCPDRSGPVAELLADMGFEIAVNHRAAEGLSGSLAVGIGQAADGGVRAALIGLADMPHVTSGHLRALLDRFDPVLAPIVASAREGMPMPPALFAASLFEALGRETGDKGARRLLAGAVLVPAGARELADIDRPGDLAGG